MKILTIICFAILIITSSNFFIFTQTTTKEIQNPNTQFRELNPLQVVERYVEIAESGNFKEIEKYTTKYPEEYYVAKDKEIKQYREMIGEKTEEKKSPAENNENGGNLIPVSNEKTILAEMKSINESDPADFHENKVYIAETENVWIKGNESRVRVKLRSRDQQNYLAKRDFLLYQINDEWKIFKVDHKSLINIYGIPE